MYKTQRKSNNEYSPQKVALRDFNQRFEVSVKMSEKVTDPGVAERGIDDNEKELGIPGTLRLVDAEHELALNETEDVILVPQPTSDPEDPLNWGKWRKRRAMWLSHLYVVGGDSVPISFQSPSGNED